MRHLHPKPDLDLIRATICAAVDAAMLQAQRLASPNVSMPSSLLAACLWIADQREYAPCDGERYFAWTPAHCCRYLDRLTHDQRAQEVAAGARVLFEGSTRRAPLIDMALTDVAGDPLRAVMA